MVAFKLGVLPLCIIGFLAQSTAAAEWHVVDLNGSDTLEGAVLVFNDDGTFSGSTGCNIFQGQARVDGAALIIEGPVATTRMACPGNALTRQDDAIIGVFDGPVELSFDPFSSLLRLGNGATELVLSPGDHIANEGPAVPEPHAGLGRPSGAPAYLNPFGLTQDMAIHAGPDAQSDVVGASFSGQVLRNDGCQDDWCKVTTLDGLITGWVERRLLEASDTALRAGQGAFDATGRVSCRANAGSQVVQCAFGVARDDGGNATVSVTRPHGLPRVLFFADGAFLGADTSEADGGHEVSATLQGDVILIYVNDERYDIPKVLLWGG